MKYFVIFSLLTSMAFGLPKFMGYERTPLGDSVDKASMKILKESFQNAKDKNVIVSPLGALTLLAMFSAGTEGKVREEIMQLLGATDYNQLEKSYGNLTERYSSMDPSYMVLANKIYVSDNYTLNDQFSKVANLSYKSEVEQVDFREKKKTADSINKWAVEKSSGYIQSPVSAQNIDPATAVALFNVILCQGRWLLPFNASETEDKDFYVSESETVKKPTMRQKSTLLYLEDPKIGAKVVELFYKEDDFRMVIVLPDEKDGLAEVVEKLSHKGILEHVFALKPAKQKIILELPKFEIRNTLNLNDILPKVGVSRIFTEGALGVVRDQPVVVSEALQQAYVKVDEEGAISWAFTGYTLTRTTYYEPPPPMELKVDHPFMFVILHEDIVLFTGTYTH